MVGEVSKVEMVAMVESVAVVASAASGVFAKPSIDLNS